MEMTPEIKAAFRKAYEFMEQAENPVGTTMDVAKMFADMAEKIEEAAGKDDLSKWLMMGVYWYLDSKVKYTK